MSRREGGRGWAIRSGGVQRREQLRLADVLREHRERLGEIATELAERGEPISPLEARLLTKDVLYRVAAVEEALRRDAGEAGLPSAVVSARVKRIGPRMKSWTKPRIGVLRHYE